MRAAHDMRFIDDQAFVLSPLDWQEMPWKNGGGVTHEVFAHPADSDTFDWRVSVADVKESGAFSRFPEVARTILLLEGRAMQLVVNGEKQDLHAPFQALDFDGDADTACHLSEGPVRDLNVMSRRPASHACRVIDSFPQAIKADDADALLLFVLQGEVEATLTRRGAVALQPRDALLVTSARRLREVSSNDAARVLDVRFWR